LRPRDEVFLLEISLLVLQDVCWNTVEQNRTKCPNEEEKYKTEGKVSRAKCDEGLFSLKIIIKANTEAKTARILL
jgi:hypothetical protein